MYSLLVSPESIVNSRLSVILTKALVLLPVLYFTEIKESSFREGGREGKGGGGGEGEGGKREEGRGHNESNTTKHVCYFSLFQQSVVVYASLFCLNL